MKKYYYAIIIYILLYGAISLGVYVGQNFLK